MKRCLALLLTLSLLLAAGCGSTPTRFYALTPLSASGPSTPASGTDVSLGVGPVEIPKALDRPQIVTRRGRNEFHLAEFDQWAEPLEDNVTQVLAENLSVLLPASRVTVYPWDRSTDIDYQVVVKVLRFDRSAGGDAVLKARWSITGPTPENARLTGEFSHNKRPAGDEYRATVEAMNQLLGEFSREVAAAIRGLRGKSP